MKKRIFKLLSVVLLAVFTIFSSMLPAYGDIGNNFLIGVYWLPEWSLTNSTQYDYLKDAHINYIENTFTTDLDTVSKNNTVLDLCSTRNMTLQVCDSRSDDLLTSTYTDVDNIAADYKNHSATGGYFIRDEPDASRFLIYANIYNRFLYNHSNSNPYLNLLPTYSSELQRGLSVDPSVQQTTIGDGSYVTSANALGQTFITASDCTLIDSVQLFIDSSQWGSGEYLTVTLWNSPTKTTRLGTCQLTSTNNGYYPIFALNAKVSASTSYYWELTHNGGGNNSIGWVCKSMSDVYANGSAYINGSSESRDFYFIINKGHRNKPKIVYQDKVGTGGDYVTSTNRVGQTFKTPSNCNFNWIQVQLNLDSSTWGAGETLTLTLWDSPTRSTNLGSCQLSATNNGNYPLFAMNASIASNTSYYWELTHNGGGNNSVGFVYKSTSNIYEDGSVYVNGSSQTYDYYFIIDTTKSLQYDYTVQQTTIGNGSYVSSANSMGQTFITPSTVNRRLTYIELYLDSSYWGATEGLTMTVYDSASKNQILGRSKMYGTNNGNYPRFYVYSNLLGNTTYYWELTHDGGGDNSVGWVCRSSSNTYTDGVAYENGIAKTYDFYFRSVFASTYQDYLEEWVDTVGAANLKYLCFDNYPYKSGQSGISNDYFLNMEYIRDMGLEKNVKTMYYLQSCGISGDLRRPNENELRYNVFTALAYGIKGLSWFTWATPDGFDNAIIDASGNKTDLYTPVQTLNLQIEKLGPTLLGLTSQAVYHSNTLESGCSSVPGNFFWQPNSSNDTVLIGYFKNSSNRKYMLVVNRHLTSTQTLTFNVNPHPATVTEVLKTTGQEVSTNYNSSTGVISASFAPGEGRLYVLPGGY